MKFFDGVGGPFCHYCDVKRDEANSLIRIHEGFPINRNAEESANVWEQLQSGDLKYKDPKRKGQTNPRIAEFDVLFYGILHSELRSLDHVLKILYHMNINLYEWSESEPKKKHSLEISKEDIRKKIKEKTGMVIDTPTSAGGNTNTGVLAKKWFSPEHREAICSVILKSEDRYNYSMLLSKFNVMCSVVQQVYHEGYPERIKEVGYDLMIFHKQVFPWAMIPPSEHSMCAHFWELFSLTNGKPIAVYSEQGSEACNKYIRNYKSGSSSKARQMNLTVNTRDVFARMWWRSHPTISLQRRLLKCSRCDQFGHTVRSCASSKVEVESYERSQINNCYIVQK